MQRSELRVVSSTRFYGNYSEVGVNAWLTLTKVFVVMQIWRVPQQLILHLLATGFAGWKAFTCEQCNFAACGAVRGMAGTVNASRDHYVSSVERRCNLLECSHRLTPFSPPAACVIARQQPKARAATRQKARRLNNLDSR
jgi:hypothetical protein